MVCGLRRLQSHGLGWWRKRERGTERWMGDRVSLRWGGAASTAAKSRINHEAVVLCRLPPPLSLSLSFSRARKTCIHAVSVSMFVYVCVCPCSQMSLLQLDDLLVFFHICNICLMKPTSRAGAALHVLEVYSGWVLLDFTLFEHLQLVRSIKCCIIYYYIIYSILISHQ